MKHPKNDFTTQNNTQETFDRRKLELEGRNYLEMKDKTFIADHNFIPFNDLLFHKEKFFLVQIIVNWHQQKYVVIGNVF